MAGFSLGGLSAALDTQLIRTSARQAKETEVKTKQIQAAEIAAREAQVVTSNSMASASKNREDQLEMYGTMDETLRIAQEAMQLSASDNPMDRLRLWMMQQTDNRYTAEGNARRLQYLNTAASALGNREVINQEAFQDQLTTIQNDLKMSTMVEENELQMLQLAELQGEQLIEAHTNKEKTLSDALKTRNALQEDLLDNMTPEQVQAAYQEASHSETGATNVGGIELTAGRLQTKLNDLKDREHVTMVREVAKGEFALNNLGIEGAQIKLAEARASETGTALVEGVELSAARIQERLQNLQNADLNAQGNQMLHASRIRALEDDLNQRYAQTLSIPQLNKAIENGGYIETDNGMMQIPMQSLIQMRAAKFGHQQEVAGQDLYMQSGAPLISQAANHSEYLKRIEANAPPNSSLARFVSQQQQATSIAAKFIQDGEARGPEGQASVMAALTALQKSREVVDAAVDAEAESLSGGDKNLKTAYTYQLKGMPIPEHVIQDGVSKFLQDNKPLSTWFGPELGGVITNAYRQAYADLSEPFTTGPDGKPRPSPTISASQKHDEAMAIAMRMGTQHAAGGMTEEVLGMQADSTMARFANPIMNHMNAQQFLSLHKRAEDEGARHYQQATGKSDEEILKLKRGELVDTGFAAAQTGAVLIELEKIKPGLSAEYLSWWDSPSRQAMMEAYTGIKREQARGLGFQETAKAELVLPRIQGDMAAYAQMLHEGNRVQVADQLQRDHSDFISFGGSPINKQLYLLQVDSDLTPSEKRDFMSQVIEPVVVSGQAAGRSSQEISMMVEQTIRTLRPQDPTIKKIHSKVMKNRDRAIATMEDFITSANHGLQTLVLMNGPLGLNRVLKRLFGETEIDQYVQEGYQNSNPAAFDWWSK